MFQLFLNRIPIWRSIRNSRDGSARIPAQVVACVIVSVVALVATDACAQGANGNETAKRLQEQKENKYRRGKEVSSRAAVIQNMKQLYGKIIVEGEGDGKADKWYSPHLRDISGTQENRNLEAYVRGQTSPFASMYFRCLWGDGASIEAACPVINPWIGVPGCKWHGTQGSGGPDSHRPWISCFSPATTKYHQFKETSNFKMCCVREGEEERATSEYIAAKHPKGDGWAGLFEYYYPTEALGWENDRTTSMIVDKPKIEACLQASDPLMENGAAQKWVTEAISRNIKEGKGSPDQGKIRETVQNSIRDVRPDDPKLRFADSLQSEGLTLRVNLATMDPQQREKTARRFCMHPKQFHKLMVPKDDELQLRGGLNPEALDALPVWSNYCREGVELMTSLEINGRLTNIDGTPTKLDKGFQVWNQDPLFCQKMNLANANYWTTGLANPLIRHGVTIRSPQSVGYTCLGEGQLNGSMVPVTLYRHAAVERRTAIADHALGFLIAGGIAPSMKAGRRSIYKRFEPQPYSMNSIPYKKQTFIGTRFGGGGTNELNDTCPSLSGENYQMKNKSDRLFLSDVTHPNQAFDQEPIDADDGKGKFNRYQQEWGKDEKSGEKIAARGLDQMSQNYAAPFRIFATCPAGYKRWRPPNDEHNKDLLVNLEKYCREENFGGP